MKNNIQDRMMITVKHQEERRILLRLGENDKEEDEEILPGKIVDQVRRRKRLKKSFHQQPHQQLQDHDTEKEEASKSAFRIRQDYEKCTSAKSPICKPPIFTFRIRKPLQGSNNNKMSTLLRLMALVCLIATGSTLIAPSGKLITATAILDGSQPLEGPKPESMALTSSSTTNNNNNNNNKQESTNVIIIKYANVTSRLTTKQQSTTGDVDNMETNMSDLDSSQLHIFKLYEPLSVQVIESKFSSSIQLFDVSENQLSTLSNNLFCPLSNDVRQLNISHNLLENFDSLGLISQAGQLCLSELRVLDMSFNLIKHLPATGVATLQNLEILNLSNNLLETLDELSLSSLFKLTKLDLSGNKIQQLPVRIFQKSTSMQVLKLQSNQLQISISQLFLAGLVSLEELDLSYNRISQINDSPFLDKINLTRVDLSHNQLTTLRQDALKVTSIKQASGGYRHRLLHNGQYAGIAVKQVHSQSASAEFYLNSNPFICDCQLEWMAKFPHQSAMKRTVLSSSSGHNIINNNNNRASQMMPLTPVDQQHNQANDQLSAQLIQLSSSSSNVYQNDQPSSSSVISQATASDSSSNNISEIPTLSNQQQVATDMGVMQQQHQQSPIGRSLHQHPQSQQVATMQASFSAAGNQAANTQHQTATHLTHHYARIGDLDLIKCTPLFRRNTHRNPSLHHPTYHHRHSHRALAPSDGSHHNHLLATHNNNNHHQQQLPRQQQQDSMMIDLLGADSSNFLCRYKSHCFALCQCCEFDACDCEMICPSGCNCFYDSTWQTNIIDCSSNNHSVVPDRIPMDVSGLYLDGNNIDSLKPSNLIARKLLKTLYLNSTNLQNIANRTFNGLIELQTLYLNDNMLRTLNGYEFEPLAQLKALYLQSNRLDHISNQTFIYLRSLEVLDLSNNRLTANNLDLFWSIGHHNIRLRQLSIAHNWWSCQCSSINRFRQILKQKFLLNGSVTIVDKNQLRCYYNSSTVGPLILAESSSSYLPLYASSPYQSGSISSGSGSSLGAISRQQQQLTEINKCSETIVDHQEVDVNPPFIQPVYTDLPPNTPGNEYPNDPYFTPQQQQQQQQPPLTTNPFQPQIDPNAIYNSDSNLIVQRPGDIHTIAGIGSGGHAHLGIGGGSSSNSIPLTSFIVLCILFAGIMVIGVSIFLFVRQQQRRYHHKKSSAASTTSASSSASSTAISSLNGKSSVPHHNNRHLQHPTMHNPHHHHHHHLIMSNGSSQAIVAARSGIANSINHHPPPPPPPLAGTHNHSLHQHSTSSQSNIYAALVSPTNTIGAAGINHSALTSASMMQKQQQAASNQGIINNHNNLYSNSSSTTSHHSTGSSHGNALGASAFGQQPPQHWQHQQSQYNAYSGALENHYAINAPSSQASYKTSSLYQAQSHYHKQPLGAYIACGQQQQQQQQQQEPSALDVTSDWIKLPKVKQFMSKLVNKSLALGGLRSSSISRDEISANTIDKIYDAFISYDKRDQAFVLQHLSSELEYGQPQYRIADRYRDLPQPNSAYLDEAITSVIGCSHRTIVVLTENYLSSDWCRYELQAALHESALDKFHKIIAVVLDPKCLTDMQPEMRALLTNSNTQVYQPSSVSAAPLVQLDGQTDSTPQMMTGNQQPNNQLVATLTGGSGGNQQVLTNCTAQLATSRISFINYHERKFWSKLKQLMPTPRLPTQALTLTTKN